LRFLHTADWHLGRLFHGASLLGDQAPLLDQLARLASESRVDALLLAGDVYDRSVPPAEAVALFDDFLSRMALEVRVPIVMIAGNHDSGERLGFAARLLDECGVHVAGRVTPEAPLGREVVLDDADGPVHVRALPYADPPTVRAALGRADLKSHDAATGALLEAVRAELPAGRRSVVVAHAFVAGGAECESERPLSVGGSGAVSRDRFAGFDYVALGHLHAPQRVGDERLRYSGSLAKYSFSEVDHRKSVSLVELSADGSVQIEEIALTARRDLRVLEGSMAELLRGPASGESADDYLLVRVTDSGALLNPIGRLREVYPNVMQLERPALLAESGEAGATALQRSQDPSQLFADFFEQVTGEALSEPERAAYAASLEGDPASTDQPSLELEPEVGR
jgi:exonuclease SbcD